MVQLAGLLELDEDSMTPAQAYSAILASCPDEASLRAMLDAMKTSLGSEVTCQGFGAVMDAPKYAQLSLLPRDVNLADYGQVLETSRLGGGIVERDPSSIG